MGKFLGLALLSTLFLLQLPAQQVEVEELVLDNGMKFLLVPRRGDPNVAAGWLAKVGSVNEHLGITGISHLFEHMMFKGTHTIGTKDIKKDLEIMARLDEIRAQLADERQEALRKLRLGEIESLDEGTRSDRYQALKAEFDQLLLEQRELLVKNEFDKIYTSAGASGMNAGTSEDFTIYFINVPANKLELWFWMESDRLLNPVFREFYAERDVVREERRLRIESTPTGRFAEQFNALFWTSSPYGWPVVGWPSDLDGITRAEALDYFAVNYAPNNLVACLVGDFDAALAEELAQKYFGRLKRSPVLQPPVRTREVEQLAERRMLAYADTNPQVEIRYHTVADGHRDDAALTVLAALFSGRTGRLYRSLVEEQHIANQVSAGQDSRKWAGLFSISGVAKQGKEPEEVEKGIYAEVEKIRDEVPEARELQKVKNRFAASSFRRLESQFALMLQLLIAENGRGWQSFNTDPDLLQAVTAQDVQRVARQYLVPENRTVGIYYRKEVEGEVPLQDPLLVSLSPEEKAIAEPMLKKLQEQSADQIREHLARMDSMESDVPEESRRVFNIVRQAIQRRLDELAKEGHQE